TRKPWQRRSQYAACSPCARASSSPSFRLRPLPNPFCTAEAFPGVPWVLSRRRVPSRSLERYSPRLMRARSGTSGGPRTVLVGNAFADDSDCLGCLPRSDSHLRGGWTGPSGQPQPLRPDDHAAERLARPYLQAAGWAARTLRLQRRHAPLDDRPTRRTPTAARLLTIHAAVSLFGGSATRSFCWRRALARAGTPSPRRASAASRAATPTPF